jgi:hypothetical protein
MRYYSDRIGYVQVMCLIALETLGGRERWVDIKEISEEAESDCTDTSVIVGGFAKLAMWGLVVNKPGLREGDRKGSGLWRLTKKGLRFLRGEPVPTYSYTFLGEHLGLSDGEDGRPDKESTINECKGKGFHFDEHMRRFVPSAVKVTP